ncbi:MAG: sugar transferase [Candidatus Hydrogenedentes bacterium]|nr:sugar transferase [Candidatus Hydrogenedentota bacterium]
MNFLKRNAGLLTLTLAACDVLCILAAAATASYILEPGDWRQDVIDHRFYFGLFILAWLLGASDQRLFASQRGDSLLTQLIAIGRTLAFSLGVSLVLMLFFFRQSIDREYFGLFGGAVIIYILVFRVAMRLFLWSIRRRGYNFRQILIIGANPRARHLVEIMISHGQYGYHLVGLLDDEPDRVKFLDEFNVEYLGGVHDLERILLEHVIDEVYICLPVRKYYTTINSAAHLCEGVGVPVRLIADLFPLRVATSRVHQLEDIPLLSLSAIPEAQGQLILKRTIDMIASAAFLLVIAWWLFPLLGAIIKLESKGPMFFLQDRVGLNGRKFKCIKFRSMVANAEALKESLAAHNEADGPVFKMKDDPRMTRFGRFIRKTSIDELPQFFNVFLGDMSLVGPRPPVPKEVAQYSWDQRRRLSVRPGITGLQQVSGRSDLSFDEWVELDLAYIDNWSLEQDLRILVRTLQVVLTGRGAR